MVSIEDLLTAVTVPRPVGSDQNEMALQACETFACEAGWNTRYQIFEAPMWQRRLSTLRLTDESCVILPSPFSPSCTVHGTFRFASSWEQIETLDASSTILVVYGELAKAPIVEARKLALLEHTHAKAIICLTDIHPSTGLSPFPLILSPGFSIPSCYAPTSLLESIEQVFADRLEVKLMIDSTVELRTVRQLYCYRQDKPKILLVAPIDSSFSTPGALYHAGSIAALAAFMSRYEGDSVACLFANAQAYGLQCGLQAVASFIPDSIGTILAIEGIGAPEGQLAFSTKDDELATFCRARNMVEYEAEGGNFGLECRFLRLSGLASPSAAQVRDTQLDTLWCLDRNSIERFAEMLFTWRL